jgi:iron complex outermembrane receptor protein
MTVGLTDTLDLTIGVRYHDQTNDTQALALIPGYSAPKPPRTNMLHTGGAVFSGTPIGVPTEVSFDKVTKKVSLQKQFNDDIMGYISYSEGFDSGGISTPTVNGVRLEYPYAPQTIENSEIGIRSDLADGRVRFNATLFHSVWKDIQNVGVVYDNQGNQLPTLVTTNVGEALAEGVELEITYLPTDHFQINANVGLLDTKYTDIAAGTFALDENTEFAQAPDTTYNVGFQYNADMANGGALTFRADYSYTSQFWRSLPFLRMSWYDAVPKNFDESGDTGIVNARVTYEPASADWSLSVFGTNLTDEYLLNSGFFHGIWGYDFATVGRPREAGVTFNFRF